MLVTIAMVRRMRASMGDETKKMAWHLRLVTMAVVIGKSRRGGRQTRMATERDQELGPRSGTVAGKGRGNVRFGKTPTICPGTLRVFTVRKVL